MTYRLSKYFLYEQMADRDDEQILYDTIAEGSSQYWNEEESNEDPNKYLNEEGNVERDAEGNEEEEASGSQPSAVQKRACGQRGAAKKIEGQHIITEVDEDGRPSAPAEAAKNYVRHSDWVVRDNVHVSTVYWRRRRARGDHDRFVPDSEKEMLWTTMLETFTLPVGTENIVKMWTLKKMAEQFQSFKGDLCQKYILKGQTLNFNTLPKLRDHWDEFVAYKTGQQGQEMMDRNKENAAKKKYHHHLGSGGYSVAMPKWEEMEASLIERGIEPATAKWPDRSKFWYYAHGGTLNPVDGSLVFSDQIREAASRLMDAVEAFSQGTFQPDREKDELSLALQTPEHPARTRGKGVVPWKIGFKEDIHTYRSSMRSKRDTEVKIADLEYRASSNELSMQEEVARKVGSQSMDAMQTQDETTCPVDEITQRTPCELHIPFKNLSIKVASGMAIPTDPSGTYHCRSIPAGYSRVEVELVEAAYEDLELDYPGGDGETHLRETNHAIILWRKRGIFAPAKKAIKLTDYERTLKKAYYRKSKPVPQLGEQPNQEVEPLVTEEEIGIKEFISDTGLTRAQLLRGAPIPKAEVRHQYELGKPLVKPEQLQSLPTQMYKFHQLYMEMSATGREMIGARIRHMDFLQGEDIIRINFKGIYELYQLDALDVSLLSCWILMEIQRARRRGVFDSGFIDPRKVNVEMIDKYPQATEDNLIHLLKEQHYKTFTLLLYNTEFHWVLLLFDLEACIVNVYDSMDKKESTFDKVFELIDRAWYQFCHLVCGNWKEKLRRKFKFAVIRTRDNLTHKEFIAAVQEQLIGFINEQVLDPEGEFYYDGNTIHKSLASELTTSTSKS
uniref:Transposon protein, putative, CACTA, En/Spm sub-class n=1 Tax=Oryza sativa subsp. japonica TaxID=39947 RepID=Q2QUY7_ORYSJ|nr:transposon protein, putative, CACTA, En/Spm sub-class [Oryza sativa Japonica Group]